MYYGLLSRFSATVEFLAPRLLRREVVIAAVVVLIIGLAFSLLADVAVFALFVLLFLWMADRWIRRAERDRAGSN